MSPNEAEEVRCNEVELGPLRSSVAWKGTAIIRILHPCDQILDDGDFVEQLFAEGEVIIWEYSPRRSRGDYFPTIAEPEVFLHKVF